MLIILKILCALLHFAFLQLSTDQLYVVAVQNTIKAYVSSSNETAASTLEDKFRCKWDPKEVNFDLLNSIKNIVGEIRDCESALALSTYVMKELPMGEKNQPVFWLTKIMF